jgi:hypothetical protein
MVGMDGLWPSQEDAPGFQHTAEAFMAHCHRVSEQLLGSFASGLGLEADFFNKVRVVNLVRRGQAYAGGLALALRTGMQLLWPR